MHIIFPLFSGILTGLVTTLFPGLINMTALKVSESRGQSAAYQFVGGACLFLALQVLLAGYIIHELGFSPRLILLLREVGILIFLLISIYFFFFANKIDRKRALKQQHSPTKRNAFLQGFLLSASNFFPIPFYLFFFSFLKSYQYSLELQLVITLAIGIVLGAAAIFILYIRFFKRLGNKAPMVLANINYIIGSITLLVCLLTILKIYW